MEKWLQKRQRLSVFFFITFFFTAFGEVTYLHKTNGSSVQFSCVSDEEQAPFAFTLRREGMQAQNVLYHNFAIDADVQDSTFVGRISDRLVNNAVDVTIKDLQGFDTDRYVCGFHYQTPAGFHNRSGRNKIVLYVKDVSFGEVTYLHKTNGSSVQFSCVSDEEQAPFAFTLRREWIQAQNVLYHNFAIDADVQDSTFVGRISDRLVNNAVDVTIKDLQGFDTDQYLCMFHYQTPAGIHIRSGRNKIVLYVKDVYMKPCSSYTPLLFALSAGAGLLFFIIVIITAVHCMKPSSRGQMKPQHSVPIYEEMNGVREKLSSGLQEDDVSSLYVKPRKENPYIN